jgi:exopolyphosphatase / guanosine-5'-triphosphate,3'-diphosphate pyrophosphatase
MFFASIDIGSNTTLLLIVEKMNDQSIRIVEDHSRVTGLGRDVQKTQMLKAIAMDETLAVLSDYVDICKKYGISSSHCVATATQASRIAKNASDFFKSVHAKCGLNVRIISSEEEADLTAKGVAAFDLKEASNESLTIMDIGGASTEFIRVELNPFKINGSISLAVGSVVCHEWIQNNEFDLKVNEMFQEYNLTPYQTSSITCVAGSMTAVAGMIQELDQFDASLINGYKVSLQAFERFVEELELLSIDEINHKYPFLGKRSSTIKAGARLALTLCKKVSVTEMRISTYGLRHGSVLEAIDGPRKRK